MEEEEEEEDAEAEAAGLGRRVEARRRGEREVRPLLRKVTAGVKADATTTEGEEEEELNLPLLLGPKKFKK